MLAAWIRLASAYRNPKKHGCCCIPWHAPVGRGRSCVVRDAPEGGPSSTLGLGDDRLRGAWRACVCAFASSSCDSRVRVGSELYVARCARGARLVPHEQVRGGSARQAVRRSFGRWLSCVCACTRLQSDDGGGTVCAATTAAPSSSIRSRVCASSARCRRSISTRQCGASTCSRTRAASPTSTPTRLCCSLARSSWVWVLQPVASTYMVDAVCQ